MRKKVITITISILAIATFISVPIVSKAMDGERLNQKYTAEISSKQQDELEKIKEEITEIQDKNLSH